MVHVASAYCIPYINDYSNLNSVMDSFVSNRYIPIEEIPVRYGGFKREGDSEFTAQDAAVSELFLKARSIATIEIPALDLPTSVKSLSMFMLILSVQ